MTEHFTLDKVPNPITIRLNPRNDMNAKYCGACGFKNDYAAIAPKFCTNCGDPFDKAFRVEAKKTVVRREEPVEEGGDPEVAALRFQINAPAAVRHNAEPAFTKLTKEWAQAGGFGGRNLSKAQEEARTELAKDKHFGALFGANPTAPQRTAQDGPAAPCDI